MEDNETEETNETAESQTGLLQLTFAETRVPGCFLEKEATTPDHHPFTPSRLHSACNQSGDHEPVTDLWADTVDEAVEELLYKKLAFFIRQAGARVPKWKHSLENKFSYLTKAQQAILCVLFLRGQQTAGGLR